MGGGSAGGNVLASTALDALFSDVMFDGIQQLEQGFPPAGVWPPDSSAQPRKQQKRARDEPGSSKACREKARRQRINDRFAELAALVAQPGTESQTDKLSILCDAIRFVKEATVQKRQLQALNKLLQDKVADNERQQSSLAAGAPTMMQQPQMFQQHSLCQAPELGQYVFVQQPMQQPWVVQQQAPFNQQQHQQQQAQMQQVHTQPALVPFGALPPPKAATQQQEGPQESAVLKFMQPGGKLGAMGGAGDDSLLFWPEAHLQSMLDADRDALLRPVAA